MDVVSAFIQVFQIVAAIVWTVLIFFQSRQAYPRISVSHRIWLKPIVDSKMLLRLTVAIENKGKVLLKITDGFARIHQVFPFPDKFVDEVKAGGDLIPAVKVKYDWPSIEERQLFVPIEIEPGECGEIQFDFILSIGIQNISIYSHFVNPRKKKKGIGWNTTTDHDLGKTISS